MVLVSAGVLEAAFEGQDTPSSADFKRLLDSFSPLISANATGDRQDALGGGAVGKDMFTAGTTASAQAHLGGAVPGTDILTAGTTASAQAHLGAGAVGIELLEAVTTASAQGHTGGGAVGIEIFESGTTASAASITGGANAATTAQVADPEVSASAQYIAPDKMRYSPFAARAYVTFTCAAAVIQSQRVSSVAAEAVGKFKITWAPALPTADYIVGGLTHAGTNAGNGFLFIDVSSSQTVSALDLVQVNDGGTPQDPNSQTGIVVFCSGV